MMRDPSNDGARPDLEPIFLHAVLTAKVIGQESFEFAANLALRVVFQDGPNVVFENFFQFVKYCLIVV